MHKLGSELMAAPERVGTVQLQNINIFVRDLVELLNADAQRLRLLERGGFWHPKHLLAGDGAIWCCWAQHCRDQDCHCELHIHMITCSFGQLPRLPG